MATTRKAPKLAKTMAAAAPKAAPRGAVVKAQEKTATAAAKPGKIPVQKTSAAKVVAAKPAKQPAQRPVKTAPSSNKPQISGEQRRNYIEVAAYFIAERNGFSATSALDHWTQAEAEIDRLLKEGKLNLNT